jgi:hypothetical protein
MHYYMTGGGDHCTEAVMQSSFHIRAFEQIFQIKGVTQLESRGIPSKAGYHFYFQYSKLS